MEQPADQDEDVLRYAVGVDELRNNLNRFLDEVRQGKTVTRQLAGQPPSAHVTNFATGAADPVRPGRYARTQVSDRLCGDVAES